MCQLKRGGAKRVREEGERARGGDERVERELVEIARRLRQKFEREFQERYGTCA